MYIKKRRGPRTDPWGTPEVALHADDFSPFRTTYCFLFIRYEHIHQLGCTGPDQKPRVYPAGAYGVLSQRPSVNQKILHILHCLDQGLYTSCR